MPITRPKAARWVLAVTVLGFGAVGLAVPGIAHADPLPPNCTGTTIVTCTFDYNGTDHGDGSDQTWTVPPGVTSAFFDVLGAQGGNKYSVGFQVGYGGPGGETTGTVALQPGTTVVVRVGGGGDGVPDEGGFNGGGPAGDVGRAGGGASDVRIGGNGLGNRVLVAGGGGGVTSSSASSSRPIGGSGGGATGGTGTSTPSVGEGGAGGTQTAGGVGFDDGDSGRWGIGGGGADGAGGGGGGFFGGAGGGSSAGVTGAGGGGSGFVLPDTTRVTGGATFNGMREGDGLVTLTYTSAPVTATTTTVTSSKNPSTEGQSVTFMATVAPNDGSGTVAFSTGPSGLGGCGAVPLTNNTGSWQASCTSFSDAAAGNHPITATYSGSALYGPSSGSLAGGQQVNKQGQTITFPAQPNRSILNSPYTITGVTGGGSGNPVTFTATGACTVSGHQVTLTHTGTCSLTAHQSGNAMYAAAAPVTRSFTVTGKPSLRIADATAAAEGSSGTHPSNFHVTMSKAVSVPVTVHWNTANGSAKAPGDYVTGSGTLTFSPGQTSRTVAVAVKGDHVTEPNEVFYVLLTNAQSATIADPNASGGILNDD